MKPDILAYFKAGKSHIDCQCKYCKYRGEDKRKRRKQLRASAKDGLRKDKKEDGN